MFVYFRAGAPLHPLPCTMRQILKNYMKSSAANSWTRSLVGARGAVRVPERRPHNFPRPMQPLVPMLHRTSGDSVN